VSEVASNLAWREWRLRFLLNKRRTPEELQRLRSTAEVSFLPMEAIGERGGLSLEQTRPKEDVQTGFSLFFEDDVVVAKITPCFENCKGALIRGLINGVGFGTTELHVLDPSDALLPEFLFYLTLSSDFRLLGEASMKGSAGQKRVPDEFLQNFSFRLPTVPEQRQICLYLDREVASIDALIADKERMLVLLDEKRTALISFLVTQGLDPNARRRHSGQLWLGQIPMHWQVERAKNLFSVRDERSKAGAEELLTVSHITGVTRRAEKDVYMFEADDKAGYKRCMPGDLAINTLWAWMGAMGISPLEGIVSPDYHVYTSKGQLIPEYIDLLCRSRPFVAEVNRWSKGVWSSRLRLYPENFFEMRLPVPPHDEQRAIVNAVEADQRKANELRSTLRQSIDLASERRSALITAAVTGQIPMEEMAA
jgi:type I restriction enzyme S subunit